MKSKRGQGLPMNSIVIAAIVLVVMVVLIMIFSGSMGKWLEDLKAARETKNCGELKGEWLLGSCPDTHTRYYGSLSDANENPGKVCCITKPNCEGFKDHGWYDSKECGPGTTISNIRINPSDVQNHKGKLCCVKKT